eukprot:1172950-Prorocentrum_minimum.AAC.1
MKTRYICTPVGTADLSRRRLGTTRPWVRRFRRDRRVISNKTRRRVSGVAGAPRAGGGPASFNGTTGGGGGGGGGGHFFNAGPASFAGPMSHTVPSGAPDLFGGGVRGPPAAPKGALVAPSMTGTAEGGGGPPAGGAGPRHRCDNDAAYVTAGGGGDAAAGPGSFRGAASGA